MGAPPESPEPDGAARSFSPSGTLPLSFPSRARRRSPPTPPAAGPLAVQLTPRDRAVLRDVYRFSCLSTRQLARRHWPESVSPKAAANRLTRLKDGGYLAWRSLGDKQDGAWLLATKGRAELGLPTRSTRPAPASGASLRHRLIAADVADWLRARPHPGGAPAWLSEVELLDGALRLPRPPSRRRRGGGDGPAGGRERGRLMVPDGVLVLRGGERVWRLAVEVELHQKASRLYDAKLAWYASQFAAGALDGCLWLCAGAGRPAPVLAAAERVVPGVADLVRAAPLPEGVTAY
jgi:Replication-relaxation